jgi:hypothetical protein
MLKDTVEDVVARGMPAHRWANRAKNTTSGHGGTEPVNWELVQHRLFLAKRDY